MLKFPARLLAVIFTLGAVCGLVAEGHAQEAVRFKDIRGRDIVLERPAQRILIDDSRYLIALALIHPDPVSLVAAWPRDINRIGDVAYQAFLKKSPALATLPKVASSSQDFAVEPILAAAPDVAVFAQGSGPTDAQAAQLEAAGVRVVFIDFFQKPLQNLGTSLRIFGAMTGRSAQAEAFIQFREGRIKAVTDRIAGRAADKRPTVFVEAHAGMSSDCCNSPGKGNVGDYVDAVGGHNIGADVIDHAYGKLNLEYVISRDPEVYIATGGPHLERTGGLVVGPPYSDEQARAALRKMAARPGIASLGAVEKGRVYGFSHQLINSPLDILAVEAFATWIHPELFGEIDPAKTLDEINTRFLAVPLPGTYWTSLN